MSTQNRAFARFAKYSNQMKKGIMQPELFNPHPDELKLSVFHIDNLSHDKIIEIGTCIVRKDEFAKRLYGWGVLVESDIKMNTSLKIEYNNVPRYHADLICWPDSDELIRKIRQKLYSLAFPKPLPNPIAV